MENMIEILDCKRQNYLKGYLIGFIVFFLVWVLRFILITNRISSDAVLTTVMVILLGSVLFQAIFAVRLNLIKQKIRRDPDLHAALHNELVQLFELKAWRTAFFSAIGCLIIIAVMSFFMPVADTVFVVLTVIMAGFGGYHLTLYILNRK
jgi:hypothetical protein